MPNLYGLPQEERPLEWLNKRDPARRGVASEAIVWVPRGTEGPPDASVTVAVVTIEATVPETEEGGEPGEFTVTRTGSTAAALTVFYSVSGTATPDVDYTALSGMVTILAGQATATIDVTALTDIEVEEVETVIATLTPTLGYFVGEPDDATVMILNEDEPWPFPACPLGASTPEEQALFWFFGENGHTTVEADGLFFAPTLIRILRPGNTGASSNAASGPSYKHAAGTAGSSDMPHDCVVACTHTSSGGITAANSWGYISFENIPYWEDTPLQIDWLAFTSGVFNAALAGGVEIWCADPAGDTGEIVASLNDFYFTSGSGVLPAPWVEHDDFDPLVRASGLAQATSLSSFAMSLVDEPLGADQWGTLQMGTMSPHLTAAPMEFGIVLRASQSAQTYYYCRYSCDGAGNVERAIDKVVAGVTTTLASTSNVFDTFMQSSDELGAEVIGTTINWLRNGIVYETATDSSIASGMVGMTAYTEWVAANTVRFQGFHGGDGPARRRMIDGGDSRVSDFGRDGQTQFGEGQFDEITGNPTTIPQPQELLYTLTTPSDLPITIPVPAGRALIFRTVNQDPTSMALGNNITADINVGFLNPDPAAAYKTLRSDDPNGANGIFTVTAASQIKLRSLVHEVTFGGVFDKEYTILVYRNSLAGNTLRVNVTAPFLWYAENPALTYIGGGMQATLTAYAVDESELVGTSEQNWQNFVKGWGYADVEARIGAVLHSQAYVTSSENGFLSGSGNFDVDISGSRKLVYYKLTAVSYPAVPTAGIHLPAISHNNPSIF